MERMIKFIVGWWPVFLLGLGWLVLFGMGAWGVTVAMGLTLAAGGIYLAYGTLRDALSTPDRRKRDEEFRPVAGWPCRRRQTWSPLWLKTLSVALFLAAPLAGQEPDTIRAEMILPIPVQMTTVGDTTVVDVSVEVSTDSLAALAERIYLARQSELALHYQLQACCVKESGTPWWFYAGSLIVGGAAVLAYASKETETTTINLSQEQSQEQSQEGGDVTVTTYTRWPFWWPPGWYKGPWNKGKHGKGHGGEE